MGARRLVGEYIPTKKNGMVKDHYAKLGFTRCSPIRTAAAATCSIWRRFVPAETFIHVAKAEQCRPKPKFTSA